MSVWANFQDCSINGAGRWGFLFVLQRLRPILVNYGLELLPTHGLLQIQLLFIPGEACGKGVAYYRGYHL